MAKWLIHLTGEVRPGRKVINYILYTYDRDLTAMFGGGD